MTDDAGDLVSFKYYEPYGNVLVDEVIGTPSDNRFDYTNKERDEETDLSYFEARYLSTDTGRFLSLDPWEGDYYDPQSLNKYAYARNNPISMYDPSGMKAIKATWAVRAIINIDRAISKTTMSVISATPGVDTFSDAYSVVVGKDVATGKTLSVADRGIAVAALAIPGVSSKGVKGGLIVGEAAVKAVDGPIKKAVQTGSSNVPNFIVTPGGTAYPVPDGAVGPVPSIGGSGAQTGTGFIGGHGGANGQVDKMRIMDPNNPNPTGYIKYQNGLGQGVDPYSGKTVSPKEAHHQIDY